jgi:putative ubiquitin-RnfH superfamily antitoxin RatB of RatAB toxin-antitoxin module
MKFEVAYGQMHDQALLSVESESPLSVQQAIESSGILQRFPEIDLSKNKVGIFGKAAKLDTLLGDGDRVEIYRPLIADPKEARKKRAAEGKAMKKGGG